MDEKVLIEALAARKSEGKRTWRCPGETELAAYAEAQAFGRKRHRVEAHLANCEFCLSQVAFLVRMQESETPTPVPQALLARARALVPPEAAPIGQPVWRWAAAAAASASVAIVATLWWYQPENSVRPSDMETLSPSGVQGSVRSGGEEIARPELLFLEEGSVIAREDVEFHWKEAERSLFYEVSIVTSEGDRVWEGRFEETYARLPADVRLIAGRKYFVWIRAYMPEGKTVKSSAVGFEVRENQ